MQSHSHSAPEPVPATERSAPVFVVLAAPCPVLAAVKARAKALKKWRRRERLRFFSGWCASLHVLGFSF